LIISDQRQDAVGGGIGRPFGQDNAGIDGSNIGRLADDDAGGYCRQKGASR
jgi:hypothetical protein